MQPIATSKLRARRGDHGVLEEGSVRTFEQWMETMRLLAMLTCICEMC